MKKNILLLCLLFLINHSSNAQSPDYRVVFDITSKDSTNQQAVVREVNLIKAANPDAKLEVVVYGQGLSLVLKGKSPYEASVQDLLKDKNVSFKVCAMTMKRNNTDKSQLIPGVDVVPDGIYEIISKQKEGWGYIKIAH